MSPVPCSAVSRRQSPSFPTRRSSDLRVRDFRLRHLALDRHVHLAALAGEPLQDAAPHLNQVIQRCVGGPIRSEEHTSELQSPYDLVCRLLLEKKKSSGLTKNSKVTIS